MRRWWLIKHSRPHKARLFGDSGQGFTLLHTPAEAWNIDQEETLSEEKVCLCVCVCHTSLHVIALEP